MSKENTNKKIILISTFAIDNIKHFQSENIVITEGGPALWISGALKKMNQKFKLVTGKNKAVVKVNVLKDSEKGEIISVSPIDNSLRKSDLFIISTISDEYDLYNIKTLQGIVAVDLQGYVRKYKKGGKKLSIPVEILNNISILKLTQKEAQFVLDKVLKSQKDRILIITKGKYGFILYVQDKKYIYKVTYVKTTDTIGAGDTFFAAFCISYINKGDAVFAAEYAKKHVDKFLIEKSKKYGK